MERNKNSIWKWVGWFLLVIGVPFLYSVKLPFWGSAVMVIALFLILMT